MQDLETLKKVLRDRGGFESVTSSFTASQVRLAGRVPPNAISFWLLIAHELLKKCRSAAWTADISRMYFVNGDGEDPPMFYSWRCLFQAHQIAEHLPSILATIHAAPRPNRVELQEFPLSGAGLSRTQTVNGRGAGGVDRVPLGPMAVAAAMSQRNGGNR